MKGRKVILGITGSIAAYKSAYLVRSLVKAGAEVRVLMTPSAMDFITPLTLSTLSKNPVFSDISSGGEWNNHVELGLWADVFLIAPATANTMAALANGICDNLLAAAYLSAKCPVLIAPAMDLDMWKHPATRENVQKLRSFGNEILPVGTGELASGLSGEGRMAEPETIMEYLEAFFHKKGELSGISALVTAGPTYEPIDPVRFIGNYSSGKMGAAIARELTRRGAHVHLVLGPSQEAAGDISGMEVHRVQTAAEMFRAASKLFPECRLGVLAAAVADYRPARPEKEKIKKSADLLQIELERTTDIAATLGAGKKKDQLLAGFALETSNGLENARKKLESKNLDLIVLNSLEDPGAGFGYETNKISILRPGNKVREFKLKPKKLVAVDIVDELAILLGRRMPGQSHQSQ